MLVSCVCFDSLSMTATLPLLLMNNNESLSVSSGSSSSFGNTGSPSSFKKRKSPEVAEWKSVSALRFSAAVAKASERIS